MSSHETALEHLGWAPFFARSFEALALDGVEPARIVVEHNHLYRVLTAAGPEAGRLAEVAGSLRHAALARSALPGVGDWVAICVNDHGPATIRAVLPRRTCFSRKAAGTVTTEQVVAANVDTVFIVAGLDDDFNPKRVERYLVATADSGAAPVVVLNKADLVADPTPAVEAVRRLAREVPIHLVAGAHARGLEALAGYLTPGHTIALLGSSGVGKSTIINGLLGRDRQRTRATRARDGRGRHTTVHRELIVHPTGGIIIDTPGMRELRLWDRDRQVDSGFEDIDRLAGACRFRDCRHGTEPGCAVQAAVAEGRLDRARIAHFEQLRLEHEELASQRAARADRPARHGPHRARRTSRRLS